MLWHAAQFDKSAPLQDENWKTFHSLARQPYTMTECPLQCEAWKNLHDWGRQPTIGSGVEALLVLRATAGRPAAKALLAAACNCLGRGGCCRIKGCILHSTCPRSGSEASQQQMFTHYLLQSTLSAKPRLRMCRPCWKIRHQFHVQVRVAVLQQHVIHSSIWQQQQQPAMQIFQPMLSAGQLTISPPKGFRLKDVCGPLKCPWNDIWQTTAVCLH